MKLLDGGSCEDGSPYLVMEYVEGLPIDKYCDRKQPSIDDRLRLFRDVWGTAVLSADDVRLDCKLMKFWHPSRSVGYMFSALLVKNHFSFIRVR